MNDSADRDAAILDLVRRTGWGRARIARAAGVAETTVQRVLKRARAEGQLSARPQGDNRTPTEAAVPSPVISVQADVIALREENRRLSQRLEQSQKHLSESRAAAKREHIPKKPKVRHTRETIRAQVPDVHGNSMDGPAVAAAIDDLHRLDPDEVVILGDLLDCGGFLAQHMTLGYVAEAEYTFADDVAAGNQFLDRLQAAAPRATIHYLEGNHEHRIEKWCITQTLRNSKDAEFLRAHFSAEVVLNLASRGIRFYRQGERHCDLTVRGTIRLGPATAPCYYTHGITVCKHSAARHVERFAANIVYGHTHRRDSYTINTVAIPHIAGHSPGCLCQRQPMYMHTDPDSWQHGYSVQFVAPSGLFQHLNVLIVDGHSFLMPILADSTPTVNP